MTETEGLLLIKAALIMLNKYADVLGSADLLEDAITGLGKRKVEDLMWKIADVNNTSEPHLKLIKAELTLTHLGPIQDVGGTS